MVITLQNNQNNTKQVYLKARFFNDNGFSAQTVENYKPLNPIVLSPNVLYQLPANGELYEFLMKKTLRSTMGHWAWEIYWLMAFYQKEIIHSV